MTIRPGWVWEGHEPGQYLRVGVVVDGVHHWRAYSITSDPGRPDGFISITPKLVETGKVTPYLVRHAHPGTIVRLGGVEGTFTLPDPLPRRLLFISAGSGVTPIMSMLRDLARRGALRGRRAPALGADGGGGHLRRAAARPRRPASPATGCTCSTPASAGGSRRTISTHLCPDWREREAFLSGPAQMLDAMTAHWERHGDAARLHMERFQPVIGGDAARRRGRPDLLPGER